jgi:UDPglucose--hexose-1-phosphate uridylyltransferase
MSELRFNRLLGTWVAIATHRQDRTFLPPPNACPLCHRGSEIVVFDNDFPSLSMPAPAPAVEETELFRVAEAIGICEVIVYTPDHDASLGSLSIERIADLIDVWIDRTTELSARPEIEYIFIFENRGEAMGVTLHHPHGQLYAYPFIPPVIAEELAQFERYSNEYGGCLFCAMRAENIIAGRSVDDGATVTTLIPFAARFPYEAHIVPNRHVRTLGELDRDERRDLAVALRRLVRGYDGLFDRAFPYVMAIHQAPAREDGEYHLHIEFYPPMRSENKLKYLAGSELGAGMFINDTLPEERAVELRAAILRESEGHAGD